MTCLPLTANAKLDPFRLTATAKFDASKRRVVISAYTGSMMRLYGYNRPVVVNASGINFAATIPLLSDHYATFSATIGAGTPKLSAMGELTVDGFLIDNPAANEIYKLLKDGVPLQASIGGEPEERKNIVAGDTLKANGRDYVAGSEGLIYVPKLRLREVSIVVLGGDPNTKVIAATAAGGRMNFEQWLQSLGLDPATLSSEQRTNLNRQFDEIQATAATLALQATQTTTQPTQTGIDPAVVSVLSNYPQLLLRAAAERWDINRARAEALETLRANRSAPAVLNLSDQRGGSVSNSAEPANIIAAALMVRAGFERGAVEAFGAETMERSRPYHGASLVDICAAGMRMGGHDVPSGRREMIRASMSGGTITQALDNTANKIMEMMWKQTRSTWRSFCKIKVANNFKEHKGLRPSFANSLDLTPKSGKFSHGEINEESTYNYRVHTYGKMYRVSYEDIVNDDVGIFSEIMPGFARASERCMSDLAYGTLFSNADDFFHTDNSNIITVTPALAAAALAAASLKAAIAKMRLQRDPEGNSIDIIPQTLLVGPTNEYTARELINSTEIQIVTNTSGQYPTGNALNNSTKIEVEPRLENGVTDPSSGTAHAGSSTRWYLFGSPSDVPLVFAFLNGQEAPSVESFGLNADPEVLAYTWRVWHVFGCAFGDYRAAVYSPGA